MILKDKELTPEAYKNAFLRFVAELAPEVMTALNALLPKYKEVFGNLRAQQIDTVFSLGIADRTEYLNEILFELDANFKDDGTDDVLLNDNIVLKNFIDFQKSFEKFIEDFGLEKPWLKMHAFDLLRCQAKNPKLTLSFSFRGIAYWIFKGDKLTFDFDGWYACDNDSKDYEKAAISAFKKHLSNYIKETAAKANTRGYTTRGAKKEYSRVEWLVRWTVQNWTMKEIWAKYDTSKGRDAIKIYKKFERKVFAAFDEFKKYELPVRLKNKHCNKLVTKNTIK